MFFQYHKALFISLLFLQQVICANEILIDPVPTAMVCNPNPHYSLINSIDYHPKQPLFCVTYTHSNKVLLYEINGAGKPVIVQSLSNPLANLSEPQHAVFSPDGEKIVVANWTNQTLTIYQRKESDFFCAKPAAIIPSPSSLIHHKPHGIAFSPCGNYLAIAYGAASCYGRAIALFYMTKEGLDCELVHVLEGTEALPGIPKGITFSPDGTCLLVTFSDVNSLVIFNLSGNNKTILQTPRQVIQGQETRIFRPEDVKISANGNYCAVSNSDQNTVTFYLFDKTLNLVTQRIPCYILQNPEACLCYPHGIAFSPDGLFMLVTEFGSVNITKEGDIFLDNTTRPKQSKFNLYSLLK
ncbi:MAG: hypothetical protein K1000chlam3_00543 [Chlamydiae bacterium]|nr:hypothetical protein [Chlamydiota bacterium]